MSKVKARVPVDRQFLRQMFFKHKPLLLAIYTAKKRTVTKELIEKASNLKVNALLRILYLIVHQAIPISYKLMTRISVLKRKFLVAFNKNHLRVSTYLLKVPLNQKKALLLKFVAILPKLLTPLFKYG